MKELGFSAALSMPADQFAAFVRVLGIDSGTTPADLDVFVRNNEAIYRAHGVPQEHILQSDTDTYTIGDYYKSNVAGEEEISE